MTLIRTLALLLLSLSAAVSGEEAALTYDRVTLSATAGEEVENDTLKAVMYIQKEGRDTERLTREVNRAVSSAVEQAKKREGIKVQTLDYTTNPVYKKSTISGWRVRQSISLESHDSSLLSKLIGTLQKQLEVGSVAYTLSPERRQVVENQLISEALAHFSERAKLISSEMGRSGYRLVEMSINSGSHAAPRPIPMRARLLEMSSAAPPTLEAGTRRVEISISAMIELQPE
ncbi:MAG: SIMPL domain-containing protein [Candidatus Sedimenticola sp. (ex Thyasira tokunagai)]